MLCSYLESVVLSYIMTSMMENFELGRGTNVGHYSATVVELRFTVLSTSLQIETVFLSHSGGPLASCSGKSSR